MMFGLMALIAIATVGPLDSGAPDGPEGNGAGNELTAREVQKTVGATPANAASRSGLDGAFAAAFGNPKQTTRDVLRSDEVSIPRKFSLAPVRLIALGGARYALIVAEVDVAAAHAFSGAIAVAYVNRDSSGWRLEQAWPEFAFTGNSGIPSYKQTVIRFGRNISYLATSKYCGMGGCEDDVAVIALGHRAPRFLGSIAGDSVFPTFDDPNATCESYRYRVEFAPPVRRQALMLVRYSGWTAPPGHTTPKHLFRVSADAVVLAGQLALRPKIRIPDCGK